MSFKFENLYRKRGEASHHSSVSLRIRVTPKLITKNSLGREPRRHKQLCYSVKENAIFWHFIRERDIIII